MTPRALYANACVGSSSRIAGFMADPVGRTLYSCVGSSGSDVHCSGHPAFGCLRGVTEVVRPPQGICLLGRSPVVPWGGEVIYMNTNHGPHLLAGTGSPPLPVVRTPTPHPLRHALLRRRCALASNFLLVIIGYDSPVDDGIFMPLLGLGLSVRYSTSSS